MSFLKFNSFNRKAVTAWMVATVAGVLMFSGGTALAGVPAAPVVTELAISPAPIGGGVIKFGETGAPQVVKKSDGSSVPGDDPDGFTAALVWYTKVEYEKGADGTEVSSAADAFQIGGDYVAKVVVTAASSIKLATSTTPGQFGFTSTLGSVPPTDANGNNLTFYVEYKNIASSGPTPVVVPVGTDNMFEINKFPYGGDLVSSVSKANVVPGPTAKYTVENLVWKNATGSTLENSDAFIAGGAYDANITLAANNGYKFDTPAAGDFYASLAGTNSADNLKQTVVVTITLPETNPTTIDAKLLTLSPTPTSDVLVVGDGSSTFGPRLYVDVGGTPALATPSNTDYQNLSVSWKTKADEESGTGSNITVSTAKFALGGNYVATVTLVSKTTTRFPTSGLTASSFIAGATSGTVSGGDKAGNTYTIKVPFSIGAPPTSLDNVPVGTTNMFELNKLPYGGDLVSSVPKTIVIPGTSAKYTVESLVWKNASGDELTSTVAFLAGATYTANITLAANNGYKFGTPATNDFYASLTGTNSADNLKQTVVVTITLPVTNPTTIGAKLLTLSPTPTSDVLVVGDGSSTFGPRLYVDVSGTPTLATPSNTDYQNLSVSWKTKADEESGTGSNITGASTKFALGGNYVATVTLVSKTTTRFPTSGLTASSFIAGATSGTVSGGDKAGNTYTIKVPFNNIAAPLSPLGAAVLTFTTKPYTGKPTSSVGVSNITVPTGTNFKVTSVNWQNQTGDAFTGNFVKGAIYVAKVTLTANSGYAFESTYAANDFGTGSQATTSANLSNNGGTIVVYINMPATIDEPTSLSDASKVRVTLDPTTFVYDGKTAFVPTTVKVEKINSSGTWEVVTTGFTTDLSNANVKVTNVGTGTITVTGDGTNFGGTKSVTFTVTPASIKGATVTSTTASATYTGKPVEVLSLTVGGTPAPAVWKNSIDPQTGNDDFDIAWGDLVNVPAKAPVAATNVTITGIKNFEGVTTGTISITQASAPTITATSGDYIANYPTSGKLSLLGIAKELFTYSSNWSEDVEIFAFDVLKSDDDGNPVEWTPVTNNNLTVPDAGGTFTLRLSIGGDENLAKGSSSADDKFTGGKTLKVRAKSVAAITIAAAGQPKDITVAAKFPRGSLEVTATGPASDKLLYTWYRVAAAGSDVIVQAEKTLADKGNVLNLEDVAASLNVAGNDPKFYCLVAHDESDVLLKANDLKSNVAAVTVRSADASVAPAVASISLSNKTVEFVSGGTFKIDYPTLSIKTASVAGVAASWKLVKLSYSDGTTLIQDNGADGVTAITSSADKGVKDIGVYTVTARFENVTEGSVGYGLYVEDSKTLTVKALAMGKNIAVSYTGKALTYDGTNKEDAVLDNISVKDGSKALVEGVDYVVSQTREWTNAGTRTITIEGVAGGNYSGTATGTFTIAKKAITVDNDAVAKLTSAITKPYDGNTEVAEGTDVSDLVRFSGNLEELAYGTDYTVKNLAYKSSAVGDKIEVTGTVELLNTTAANNYSLATSSATLKTTGAITKGTATAAAFKFSDPEKIVAYYTGKAQGIGTVSWASGVSNGSGDKAKITVLYNDEAEAIEPNTYTVTANIIEGTSFLESKVDLGTFTILEKRFPKVTMPSDTSYRVGGSVVLKPTYEDPNGKTASLQYLWFKSVAGGEPDSIKGKTGATLTLSDKEEGSSTYYVRVTYKPSASIQEAAATMSAGVTVTVKAAPVSLANATVSIFATPTFTGSKLGGAEGGISEADVQVSLGGNGLTAGLDYTVTFSNDINAGVGSGVATIKGIEAYSGQAVGTFTILPATLTSADLVIGSSVEYNGTEQPLKVSLRNGKSAGFAAELTYTPVEPTTETTPLNAGSWTVKANINGGQNYSNLENEELGTYTIRKVVPTTDMFAYNIPTNHKWTGAAQGIGDVSTTGVAKFYTKSIKTLYTKGGVDSEAAPSDSGVYAVTLLIEGDANFNAYELPLGNYEIHGAEWTPDAVKEVAREIPNQVVVEEATVAPVKKVTANVTVGPSPVVSGNTVTVFYNGTTAVSGKLAIFTSAGKKIATLNAKGTKNIGTWNTTGVTEGTYLVKGVLKAKDGASVKVLLPVAVVK